MTGDLYDDPSLYDLVAPPDREMEGFYSGHAGGPGRSVLELCCGSGRLTLPVAATGCTLVAGDISETMLDVARKQASAAKANIDFVHLDMRDFALKQQFDAIFVGANSLLHLVDQVEFRACLNAVARHLKPDGRFYFDVFVPSLKLLCSPPDVRHLVGTFAHPTLGPVTIEETIRYDPVEQLSHAHWYWSHATEPDFRETELIMRQIFPAELPLLMEAGGFRMVERYGGFDGSRLTAASRRQVCICAKA